MFFLKKRNKKQVLPPGIASGLIEAMPDAVVIADHKNSIVFINYAASRLLVATPKDLIGKPIMVLMSDKFCPRKEDFFSGHLKAWNGVWRAYDGSDIPVSCALSVIKSPKNQDTYFVYIARNIREAKKSEEALLTAYKKLNQTREKLVQTEKMAVVGKLAGGIAHEIRNPLAIILQGAYLLGNFIPKDNRDGHETLDMVKDAVKRADVIIARLLEYSRTPMLESLPVDIQNVIEEAILFAHAYIPGNVKISTDFKAGPFIVDCDRVALGQLFFNLIMNSIEAFDDGGEITIKVYNDAGMCITELSDDGKGIDEENMPKIFEPFFTTKMAQKHAGLGLPLVQMITQRHKGTVKVVKNPARGVTFIITLPLATH